jgi:hypothetical protein
VPCSLHSYSFSLTHFCLISGYTLNKAALKLLVMEGFPMHFQDLRTSAEDIHIAKTFLHFGVLPYITADDLKGQRYHHFTPGQHYADEIPGWVRSITTRGMSDVIFGQNHSAVKSVSFHSIKPPMLMRRLHAILYNLCPEVMPSSVSGTNETS